MPARPNLNALFTVVGRMHGIDPSLLEAMAEIESGGDANGISPKGAMGLMQLMPATASQFSVADAFDPVSNVIGAADFINYLRARIGAEFGTCNLSDLLAAYNAGPKAVEKYGGVPPYPETRRYIQKVLVNYQSHSRWAVPKPLLLKRNGYDLNLIVPERRPMPLASRGEDSVLDQLSEIKRLRTELQKAIRRGFSGEDFRNNAAIGGEARIDRKR